MSKNISSSVGVAASSDVATIDRNVDNVACDALAIAMNVFELHGDIANASVTVSATQIAGPEAPSYLGETCFGGLDAGSNRAKLSADGRGWQGDIVENDFLGQEMVIDMPRARSNVAHVHCDRREDECNIDDFHKNLFSRRKNE